MFNVIKENEDIGRILSELGEEDFTNIIQSGPILGIMRLDISITTTGKKIRDLSSVDSELIDIKFHHWKDIKAYIQNFMNHGKAFHAINNIPAFKKTVSNFANNEKLLYCHTLALFIESLMESFSISFLPLQEKVKAEIETFLSREAVEQEHEFQSISKGSNAAIYVSLHAGERPFVQVSYPESSNNHRPDELEAGSALCIRQVLDRSMRNLEAPEKLLLREMMRNECLSWENEMPKLGDIKEWSWLPVLGK